MSDCQNNMAEKFLNSRRHGIATNGCNKQLEITIPNQLFVFDCMAGNCMHDIIDPTNSNTKPNCPCINSRKLLCKVCRAYSEFYFSSVVMHLGMCTYLLVDTYFLLYILCTSGTCEIVRSFLGGGSSGTAIISNKPARSNCLLCLMVVTDYVSQ